MIRPVGVSLAVGAICTLAWAGLVYEPMSTGPETGHWPASMTTRLAFVFNEWTRFSRWNQSSVNVYDYGESPFLPANPVFVSAIWLAVSLSTYALYRVLSGGGLQAPWRAAGAIGLICWIALDSLWQLRLSWQVRETYQQFAGKSEQAKLMAADDGLLYRFLSAGLEKVESRQARFFVASSLDYYAVRSAYHLFPANVFWSRRGPELPAGGAVHSDDYVIVVQAETVAYFPEQSRLCWKGGGCRLVDTLALAENAGFFRVR